MKKIYQYILLAVAMVATASCSNELDDTLQPVENGTLQFVVGDFPAFGEDPQTRASSLGTPDVGKTAWETNDKITVIFTSEYYGEQTATLTYNGSAWTSSGTLSYLENEIPVVSAVYNPCADTPGLGEYLTTTDCTLANNALSINFEDATRTYSRLRIVTLADLSLAVTTTGFTPAGAEEAGEHSYTITTDKKGNAYLYGTFAEGATVSVKQGDVTLKDYTFTAEKNPNGTEQGKSYALQAGLIIDGTFGGKAEVTDDNEISALVKTIQDYVESGGSAVIVTGSELAIYNGFYDNYPAYAEALYYVTEEDENSKYCGSIDLILPDVTEIGEYEFNVAFSLKSVTLPKVTTIGDAAFWECMYLQTLTFGSVVTSIGSKVAFSDVGLKVEGGTNLVLNCEQMQTEGNYKPNLETNEWGYNSSLEEVYKWKSITLTHTGACDECKANQ
jgi:hypothetical protein